MESRAGGGLPALTAASLLQAVAAAHATRTALVWDGGTLTYAELWARAGGVARMLAARGLRPPDRIAVALPNGPGFAIAVLGGLQAGLTVAPLDPLLATPERAELVADLQPALVLEEMPSEGGAATAPPPGDAPALVLYTSGSTGRPKGAVLSQGALVFALRSWAHDVMALRPEDVVLAALPLSHSYGLASALLAPLLAGAAVRLVERFTPEGVSRALRDDGATVLPAVATMLRRLLDQPGFAGGPRLRLAVAGAAACPWPLAQEWRARTTTRVLRGYGMTELFRPVSYLASDTVDLPETIGRAVPGVDLRVVGDEAADVPAGQTGELLIRSPAAMTAYLGAPADTAAVMRGGWFHTGDLATVSADGWVTITGRKRERILRGGYSVFPSEVERVLAAHPDVAEAAVLGIPDRDLGEEVAAFVALRPGAAAGAEALLAYCRERLAAFKCPRVLRVVERLPRSSTGKVLKPQLLPDPTGPARPGIP